jgi:hypothetical protein
MEWVKPIVQVEREIRERGMFMLVDPRGMKLQFFGYNQATVNRERDALRGRSQEMVKYLIALASAKGETT